MEIEIIKIQTDNLDSTRSFGIILKKISSFIHLLHWYSDSYQIHEILGELYESTDNLFDKLQEEIIGTAKLQNATFPSFSSELNIEDISQYKSDTADQLSKITTLIEQILTSLEFNNYITTVKSGITNTKEEIISAFNKANYLVSLINR